MLELDRLRGLREISMFTGAGGGVLSTRLLGWETVQYVEWDPYCQEVLRARIKDGFIHDAPIHGDVGTFDGASFRGKVDVVHAGFPCTSFSVAGKQLAGDDERNRWPDTIRVINAVQPKYAFLENVPGLLSGGHGYFGIVLRDLVEAGYDAVWSCLPASAVGAPHRRDRLWILATRSEEGPMPSSFKTFARLNRGAWVTNHGGLRDGAPVTRTWPRAGVLRASEVRELPPLATSTGETSNGGWPWPDLLGNMVGMSRSPVRRELPVAGPNSMGQWPTPVTHDQSTNYAQGGMSLGYAARWPTPNTLDAAPPRDPATVAEWNNARDGRTGRKALANLRQAVVDPYYQERFPTPRAEDSECAGAHRGVPDTLTSYTRVRPTPQMFCTPTVEDASRSGDAEMAQKWARGERVPDTHQRLRTQVLVPLESFPTPTVYDATGHGAPRAEQKEGSRHAVSLHHLAAEWPTPTSADGKGGPGGHRGGGENLRTAVANHADTSWPTPRSKDWKGADLARDENRSGARHSGDDLATAVEKARVERFPTPTLSDATGGRTTAGDHVFSASPNAHVRGLRDGMDPERKTWPTPMAGPVVTQDGGGHGGVALATAATEEEAGPDAPRGQLNPDWVELLMGWPKGWTSTAPLPTEEFQAWLDGFDLHELHSAYVATHRDAEEVPCLWEGVHPKPVSERELGESQGFREEEVLLADVCGLGDQTCPEDSGDTEGVCPVWGHDDPEADRGPVGGPRGLQATKILQSDVCEHAGASDLVEHVPLACSEAQEGLVRSMWVDDEPARTPRRWERGEQQPGEPPNALRPLPQLPSRYGATAWADGSWEASVPRIGTNIPNRVPRLKAIGNGQVSLCAAWAVLALYEMDLQVVEASKSDGPPEVDFFDFIDGL